MKLLFGIDSKLWECWPMYTVHLDIGYSEKKICRLTQSEVALWYTSKNWGAQLRTLHAFVKKCEWIKIIWTNLLLVEKQLTNSEGKIRSEIRYCRIVIWIGRHPNDKLNCCTPSVVKQIWHSKRALNSV